MTKFRPIAILAAFAILLLPSGLSYAREDYFRPAVGEVVAGVDGFERAAVTSEGGLNLYEENGGLAPGFPLFIENKVIASAPILADITGDGVDEIVFTARDAAGAYTLYTYRGDAALLAFAELGAGVTAYYDPVEMPISGGSARDIALATEQGDALAFHYENGGLVSRILIDGQDPHGVSFNTLSDRMAVNYPTRNELSVYRWNGAGWAQERTINTASPIIYPVVFASTSTIYGVNRDNNLVAYNSATGVVFAGFPKALGGAPLDSPFITDRETAQNGLEVVVPLANGKEFVVRADGSSVSEAAPQKSFLEHGGSAPNIGREGIFASVRGYAILIYTKTSRFLSSLVSRLSFGIMADNPRMEMWYGGNKMRNGESIDFGVIRAGRTVVTRMNIQNGGVGELQINNGAPLTISGANAGEFAISSQPALVVAAGASAPLLVSFSPTSGGEKEAMIEIPNNDVTADPVILRLRARANPATVYENAEDGGTVRWHEFSDVPGATVIRNVLEQDTGNRVIDINTAGGAPAQLTLAGGLQFGNNENTVLEMDIKFGGPFAVTVNVDTQDGQHHLVYSPQIRYDFVDGYHYRFALNTALQDGAWHTLTRDLAQDIASLNPSNSLVRVNYILVQGTGMVDAVVLADSAELGMVSGTVRDENGVTVPGAVVSFAEAFRAVITDGAGVYRMPGLAYGEYTVTVSKPDYEFEPPNRRVILGVPLLSGQDFSARYTAQQVVYEDAEDAATLGWRMWHAGSENSSIENILDEEKGSRVIALTHPHGGNPNFVLYTGEGRQWNNQDMRVFSIDVKFDDDFILFVNVSTQNGWRYITYRQDVQRAYLSGNYAGIPMSETWHNGAWQSFERNLQADLSRVEPGNTVTSVNYLIVSGSGRVDNIALRSAPILENEVTVTGAVADRDGAPIAGANVEVLGTELSAVSDEHGMFNIPNVSFGAHSFAVSLSGYVFDGVPRDAIIDELRTTVDFVGQRLSEIVYEDAQDGTTLGWRNWGARAANLRIENIMDEQTNSRVIELYHPQPAHSNFVLYTDEGRQWNNPSQRMLSMDVNFSASYVVFVNVSTPNGWRYVTYLPGRRSSSFDGGNYVHIGLPASWYNGQWQTLTRDLQADLQSVEPGNTITSVNYLIIAGNGRVDNIKLMDELPVVQEGVITGTITDSLGAPIAGAEVSVFGAETLTDEQGRYQTPAFRYGEYTARAELPGYTFADNPRPLTLNADTITVDFVGTRDAFVLYEDAEDAATLGWVLSGMGSSSSTVANIIDEQTNSRVIELTRPDGSNTDFYLYTDEGRQWNNPSQRVLSMDVNFSSNFIVFVYVSTPNGWRYITYLPGRRSSSFDGGNYAHIGLPASWYNGEWQTLTRDLQADLQSVEPGNTITSVNYLIIAGNGRVDNIKLMNEMPVIQEGVITGTITDSLGAPIAGAVVSVFGDDTQTDEQGRYTAPALRYGNYTITVSLPGYIFADNPRAITLNADSISADFTGSRNGFTMYEDAEDAATLGWHITGVNAASSTIENIIDEQTNSRVIALTRPPGTTTDFRLFTDTGRTWNNRFQRVLSMDVNFSESYIIFIQASTQNGPRYITYRTDRLGSSYADGYATIGLPTSWHNGQWQTLVRDLQADLESVEPGNNIIQVNYMIVSGNGRVDNIRLMDED